MTKDAGRIVDEAFITPRVLDQRAFDELASSLRELITQAAERGRTLEQASDAARGVLGSYLEARPALESRSAAVAARIEELESRLAHAESRVALAVERAETAAGLEVESRARREQGVEREVERARERLDSALAQAIERIDASLERAVARIEHANERAAGERADLEKDLAGVEERARTTRAWLVALVGPELRALHDLCERGAALLGRTPGEPESAAGARGGQTPAPDSLAACVLRGESLAREAGRNLDRLSNIAAQADEARTLLGEAINGATERIDDLRDRHEHLREAAGQSESLAAHARDELISRASELRAALDLPVRRATAEGERLATLIEQAEQAERACRGGIERAGASVESMMAMLRALEPWRAWLRSEEGGVDATSAPRGEPPVPEPIRAIIDRVREEIGLELSRVASGFSSLAERARSAAGDIDSSQRASSSAWHGRVRE